MVLRLVILYSFLNFFLVQIMMMEISHLQNKIIATGSFSQTFVSRTREYPCIKNASAQPWAFKSTATMLNVGMDELKGWKIFIGFQNREILVSATNVILEDGDGFPAPVGNGTTLSGYPQTDLKNSIETAGVLNQIQIRVELTGAQFGIRPPGYPMARTIKLVFSVHLLIMVTIDNQNPLGLLDHWNLTREWMRGEFIYSMRGAYTRKKDTLDCIYGAAGQYYQDLDFSKVMCCEKKPIIGDLPQAGDCNIAACLLLRVHIKRVNIMLTLHRAVYIEK